MGRCEPSNVPCSFWHYSARTRSRFCHALNSSPFPDVSWPSFVQAPSVRNGMGRAVRCPAHNPSRQKRRSWNLLPVFGRWLLSGLYCSTFLVLNLTPLGNFGTVISAVRRIPSSILCVLASPPPHPRASLERSSSFFLLFCCGTLEF